SAVNPVRGTCRSAALERLGAPQRNHRPLLQYRLRINYAIYGTGALVSPASSAGCTLGSLECGRLLPLSLHASGQTLAPWEWEPSGRTACRRFRSAPGDPVSPAGPENQMADRGAIAPGRGTRASGRGQKRRQAARTPKGSARSSTGLPLRPEGGLP